MCMSPICPKAVSMLLYVQLYPIYYVTSIFYILSFIYQLFLSKMGKGPWIALFWYKHSIT